ncbi:DUF3267 domain-containing protein [Ancylomarina salipaludis]|uniref:DUF3267 domain-containing protein n=1 Tax=Ancylomarina salipaludis TaxID=2501299 RepID=A0A4Q1JHM0_9BACT|nr:DUF3267 domain-containing protein [Ancylomarina salipaludis]RXQ87400.1 DUF3267 domain-containing protein [Ancylomarina salipaludis]
MEEIIKPDNQEIEEYTMELGRVNLIALLLAIPITAAILFPFILIWDYATFKAGKEIFSDYFLYILIGGIIIHELLHGLTWGYFASKGLKSIKFGIRWKFLTPYCHCKEPLKVKHYKMGGAMPLIIMGIIPSIIGLIIGHGGVLIFGMLFTYAAGGDMIALYMLQKLDNNIYVSDHPNKMGFIRNIV